MSKNITKVNPSLFGAIMAFAVLGLIFFIGLLANWWILPGSPYPTGWNCTKETPLEKAYWETGNFCIAGELHIINESFIWEQEIRYSYFGDYRIWDYQQQRYDFWVGNGTKIPRCEI